MPYTPQIPNYFCITGWANGGCSQLRIRKKWSPYPVDMEVSFDWLTWAPYTIDVETFTLSAWQKLYFRNASTTNTLFSTNARNYYYFWANWTYECSWDIWYLINKNSTNTIPDYWFNRLFWWSNQILTPPELPATNLWAYCYALMFSTTTQLTTAPELPATTLAEGCYNNMFYKSSNITTPPALPATILAVGCYDSMFLTCNKLEQLPELPATTLAENCYLKMFQWCSKIKVSETQTWEYQTAYRIPTTWTWITATNALANMFAGTGWTFTGTPDINTTYYTSNTIVS